MCLYEVHSKTNRTGPVERQLTLISKSSHFNFCRYAHYPSSKEVSRLRSSPSGGGVYFNAGGHSDPFQVIPEGQMRSKKVRQLLNLIKNQISDGDGQIN